ncbi:MAG: hypothetical protein AAGE93_24500 [Bacteroidota bacterium]
MEINLHKHESLREAALLAINNTQSSPERQQQLLLKGFGASQLSAGENLLKMYDQKVATQIRWQNEQWAISQQMNIALEAVEEQFKLHVRVARVALRNKPEVLHSLKVDRFSTRQWECIRQAEYFYSQLAEQKISLKVYEVSDKELKQAQTDIDELQRLKEARVDRKSKAEHSTQEKQQAQEALRIWVKDFHTIARMAFREQPQALEAYGIQVQAKV